MVNVCLVMYRGILDISNLNAVSALLWSAALLCRHLHHRQRLGSHRLDGERVLLHGRSHQLRQLRQRQIMMDTQRSPIEKRDLGAARPRGFAFSFCCAHLLLSEVQTRSYVFSINSVQERAGFIQSWRFLPGLELGK